MVRPGLIEVKAFLIEIDGMWSPYHLGGCRVEVVDAEEVEGNHPAFFMSQVLSAVRPPAQLPWRMMCLWWIGGCSFIGSTPRHPSTRSSHQPAARIPIPSEPRLLWIPTSHRTLDQRCYKITIATMTAATQNGRIYPRTKIAGTTSSMRTRTRSIKPAS